MNSTSITQPFSLRPSGPFDLANQNRYFAGWPTVRDDPDAIAMAFPLERAERAVGVLMREDAEGMIQGEVHGCPAPLRERAWRQALSAISLDVDALGWAAVGQRDPVIGRLQARYGFLRPSLFHSPYEAAAAFVIGHRISVRQARTLRARLASEAGSTVTINGQGFPAFPTPGQMLAAEILPGVNQTKTERLRAIARAAQEGWLTREALREISQESALARLQTLPGVGPFFSQAILHRGAGTVDVLVDDEITRFAVSQAYGLDTLPTDQALEQIAERWKPYRTWTGVLLHVWARTELGAAGRRAAGRPAQKMERPDPPTDPTSRRRQT